MEHIPYFDAHCDTIYRCLRNGAQLRENDGHLDLRRASAFGRFAQVFALYQDPEEVPQGSTMVREGQLLHQKFLREMEQNRDVIVPCRTGAEVDRAAADGKMAAILSIEGAELIGCDPGQVETAAEWGVRFLNPVWNWPNVLSGTNCRDTDRGLSPLGADFLRQLEACHICPDVSHISDPGFWDVVRLARGPVVATHSNSRALCPHRRNLTDDMFRAIRDSGGVVGLNLYRPFVGPAGTMEELVARDFIIGEAPDAIIDIVDATNLERNLGYDREVIYAAAILHDIGKSFQYEERIPHEIAGEKVASEILDTLPEGLAFSAEERRLILAAVREHRKKKDGAEPIAALFYDSDKRSRTCFSCPAEKECNWKDEEKNKEIII